MPPLEKCCCCAELRIGCLIIGWLVVISSAGYFVNSIIAFIPRMYTAETSNEYELSKMQHVMVLIFLIINFFISVSLVYGSHQSKKIWLLPWLIVEGLSIVITLVIILYTTSQFFYANVHITLAIWILIFGLSFGVLEFYFFLCVLSFYIQLKEKDTLKIQSENTEAEIQAQPSAPQNNELYM